MEQLLTIGEAARRVGLKPSTIRYYEGIGVIPRLRRNRAGFAPNGGYRLLSQQDVNRLRFVKKARQLELPLAQVKELLAATERGSATPQLLSLVQGKLSEIDQQIRNLRSLRRSLEQLWRRALEGETAAEPCCEPVCGPLSCEPGSENSALIQIGNRKLKKEVGRVER